MSQLPEKYIEYVITVHGIGSQRPSETVLPVINRFAEVRQQQKLPKNREVVSLGMISSQSGKPEKINGLTDYANCQAWSEFKNIPARPKDNPEFFLGEPSYSGDNIRFVDMNWADIMSGEFGDVGQETAAWTDTLLDRLEMKEIRDKKNGTLAQDTESKWVLPVLYQVEETLIFMKSVLSIKTKKISDMIFDQFLGDVQLYGEYLPIRGRAVRRFHDLMNKIEREHIKRECPNHQEQAYSNGEQIIRPRYTFIAHSLGTVMTMDTLLYGHLSKKIYTDRRLAASLDNLPFPQYTNDYDHEEDARTQQGKWKRDSVQYIVDQKGEYIGGNWIDNVHNFVTLGSPIDKFLAIWWQNYEYLNYVDLFQNRTHKIKHFNYCDEQDPVGHLLDLFEKQPVYKKIFEKHEDIVYNRYAVPGVAHVDYWGDYELFSRIVQCTIDNKPIAEVSKQEIFKDFADKEGTYQKVMWFSYGILPLLMTLVCSFFVLWGWESKGSTASTMASVGLIASCFLFRRLIKLSIWWRQILKAKNVNPDAQAGEYVLAHRSKRFRSFCNVVLVGLLGFSLLYIPSYFSMLLKLNEFDWHHHVYDFGSLLGLGLIGSYFYHKFLYKPRAKYKIKFGLTVDSGTVGSISLLIGLIALITYLDFNILEPAFNLINPFKADLIEMQETASKVNETMEEQFLDYQREQDEEEGSGYGFFNVLTLLSFTATSVWIFTLNCLDNAKKEVAKVMGKI
jgi:hypothetical protein